MRVRIDMLYSTPKKIEAAFSSEEMSAGEAVVMTDDMLKTGRVKEVKYTDAKERVWTLKELKKLLKVIEEEPHDIKLYFDGGFDIESSNAGLGCVIYYKQTGKSLRLRKNAFAEGLVSNNEAEYAALHLALQELEFMGVHHLPVEITGDSKVVINQLNGEWPVYEPELAKWADRIESKMQSMGIDPIYEAISRKGNREADQLAAQALRGEEVTSTFNMDHLKKQDGLS